MPTKYNFYFIRVRVNDMYFLCIDSTCLLFSAASNSKEMALQYLLLHSIQTIQTSHSQIHSSIKVVILTLVLWEASPHPKLKGLPFASISTRLSETYLTPETYDEAATAAPTHLWAASVLSLVLKKDNQLLY